MPIWIIVQLLFTLLGLGRPHEIDRGLYDTGARYWSYEAPMRCPAWVGAGPCTAEAEASYTGPGGDGWRHLTISVEW